MPSLARTMRFADAPQELHAAQGQPRVTAFTDQAQEIQPVALGVGEVGRSAGIGAWASVAAL